MSHTWTGGTRAAGWSLSAGASREATLPAFESFSAVMRRAAFASTAPGVERATKFRIAMTIVGQLHGDSITFDYVGTFNNMFRSEDFAVTRRPESLDFPDPALFFADAANCQSPDDFVWLGTLYQNALSDVNWHADRGAGMRAVRFVAYLMRAAQRIAEVRPRAIRASNAATGGTSTDVAAELSRLSRPLNGSEMPPSRIRGQLRSLGPFGFHRWQPPPPARIASSSDRTDTDHDWTQYNAQSSDEEMPTINWNESP